MNFRSEARFRGGAQFPANFVGRSSQTKKFAIAYGLNFERFLAIHQEGIRAERMLRYVGNNTKPFKTHRDCVDVVTRAIEDAHWESNYSRRRRADGLIFRSIIYRTHVGATWAGKLNRDLRAVSSVTWGGKGSLRETARAGTCFGTPAT